MSEPNTSAVAPVPKPMKTPQRSESCHAAFITVVSPVPSAIKSSAAIAMRLMPKRSMSAAANGAVSPYTTRFTDTATLVAMRAQPRSSSIGTIMTPNDDRNAAAAMRIRKVTSAIAIARPFPDFMSGV